MTCELGNKRCDPVVGQYAVVTPKFVVVIASRSRRDVQVDVRDILASGHAVVDQHVVAIWTQCLDESSCPAMRLGRHLRSDRGFELVPQHDVQPGNHEHVPACSLIAIEDDEAPLALVEHCALEVSATMRQNVQPMCTPAA